MSLAQVVKNTGSFFSAVAEVSLVGMARLEYLDAWSMGPFRTNWADVVISSVALCVHE